MKLYIVVLKSLSAGLKAAQACHAMFAFTQAYPVKTKEWSEHNNIVVLEHDDLPALADMLDGLNLSAVRFHEPDMDDQLTAICVEPSAWRHVSSLKLAG